MVTQQFGSLGRPLWAFEQGVFGGVVAHPAFVGDWSLYVVGMTGCYSALKVVERCGLFLGQLRSSGEGVATSLVYARLPVVPFGHGSEFGVALSHVRVVRNHSHRVDVMGFFASVSAFSLPAMFMWPGVPFPLIVQPLCCRIV